MNRHCTANLQRAGPIKVQSAELKELIPLSFIGLGWQGSGIDGPRWDHYNDYGYNLEAAMLSLKLRKVGTSTGLVLPKEMLGHLHAKEGQEIYAVETPTGYTLTTLDPRVQKQVEIGEAFMERYRDVFAVLAK
jgi:putative addiction module antidote